MKVIKRDGREVEFDRNKIEQAIIKAMKETEKGVDENLALVISVSIYDKYKSEEYLNMPPTVEDIQDVCEELLASNKRFDCARKYILYREERAKIRNQGWEMTDLQKDIYEQKYRFEGESFDEFLDRVSGGNEFIKKAIRNKEVLPAGRILAGRGLHKYGKKVTLSNCFVLRQPKDNIESIFDTARDMAKTYSWGGGVGIDISNLRPEGSKVNNAARSTSGVVSFMDLYSMTTGLICQEGRRGALMISMDCHHPDLLSFLAVKSNLDKVTKANISVMITDDFMIAVKNNTIWEMKFEIPENNETIIKHAKAKDIFRLLCEYNHDMAEPGIILKSRIDSWHLMSEDKDFEFAGLNPCARLWLM